MQRFTLTVFIIIAIASVATGCTSLGLRPDSSLQDVERLADGSVSNFQFFQENGYGLQFEVMDTVKEKSVQSFQGGERIESPNLGACLTLAIQF